MLLVEHKEQMNAINQASQWGWTISAEYAILSDSLLNEAINDVCIVDRVVRSHICMKLMDI